MPEVGMDGLDRDLEVIWMTAHGAGPAEIAARLGLSEAAACAIIRRLAATETLMRAALEAAAADRPAPPRRLIPYAGKP